jgi:mono/diheme cytochrome c family protein
MRYQFRFLAVGTMLSVVVVNGCSKAPGTDAQSMEHQAIVRSGESIFQSRCFVCHGRQGRGDGPAATGLGAPVRDLTNAAWQESVTDETMRLAIRNGARAVGGNAAMAPNPDLSDDQIQSLVQYIRALRQ